MNHNHRRDLASERAVGPVLTDLVNKGGGTYQAGSLTPFTPSYGYAVGIGGVTLPVGGVDSESLSWAIGQVASEFRPAYIGTWLDDGVVYIDAVMYFRPERLPEALNTAYQAGQLAIFDFGTQSSILVGKPEDFVAVAALRHPDFVR